jgi:hypothetical protein
MARSINKYGWPLVRGTTPDEAWHYYEQFYEVEDAGGGVTYKRLEGTNPCVIWRETVTSSGNTTNTKLEFSWGDWADRANLTYVPINGSLNVP